MSVTMFSCKYVFLFLILISSPVHWWCSCVVSLCPVCCTSRGHCERDKEMRKKFRVCAEPWMHVMVLWSRCSQEWVQGSPEEFLQWEWMSEQGSCACLHIGMFTQHKALLGCCDPCSKNLKHSFPLICVMRTEMTAGSSKGRKSCLNLAGLLAFGLPPDVVGLGEASLSSSPVKGSFVGTLRAGCGKHTKAQPKATKA